MDRSPLKLALATLLGLGVMTLLPIDLFPPNAFESVRLPRVNHKANSGNKSPYYYVGLIACRADTGVYVGVVDSVTFDGKQWIYGIAQITRVGQRRVVPRKGVDPKEDAVPSEEVVRSEAGPAADYTLTRGKCPDRRSRL